jgi:hypothetical protein
MIKLQKTAGIFLMLFSCMWMIGQMQSVARASETSHVNCDYESRCKGKIAPSKKNCAAGDQCEGIGTAVCSCGFDSSTSKCYCKQTS